MTTALLRRAARCAEERLEWYRAARLYGAALDRYPTAGLGQSALASADRGAILRRRDTCLSFNGRA